MLTFINSRAGNLMERVGTTFCGTMIENKSPAFKPRVHSLVMFFFEKTLYKNYPAPYILESIKLIKSMWQANNDAMRCKK